MSSRAGPMPSLLRSYSAERWVEAKRLVDTDHEWARIMSAPPGESELDGGGRAALRDAFQEEPRIHRRACGEIRRKRPHRAGDPPGVGDRRGDRPPVPFRPGRAGGRRQADAARPRRRGRRALADLCLSRGGITGSLHGAGRLAGADNAELAGREDTPSRARISTR